MLKRKDFIKKTAGLCLTAAMCVSLFAGAPVAEAAEPDDLPLADVSALRLDCQDGVTLHCFCWSYKDIMEELPQIKDAGFSQEKN